MSFFVAAVGAVVGGVAGIGTIGILGGAALGAVGGAFVSGQVQAASAQRDASRQATANAQAQARAADEATNRANQRSPDVSGILGGATNRGSAGVSGTLLTGPGGVGQDTLTLGRSTLLGGGR